MLCLASSRSRPQTEVVGQSIREQERRGMKEKPQRLALLAEIVSAVAVVLSLLYVGYQVRESTEQARLDSIRTMDQGHRFYASVA